jgi:hypothetical protein
LHKTIPVIFTGSKNGKNAHTCNFYRVKNAPKHENLLDLIGRQTAFSYQNLKI